MIVDLKEKLKPNTFLYYDGKQLISVSRDELLGDIDKKLKSLNDFQDSLLKRQQAFEERSKTKFRKFLSIFSGGGKK